ncbi:hypothetical protein DSM3645_27478 [Blastopirellula marina DSM 3645]|uniref:Uncharacterized protein n=1 Tax=Blastopirellula marina DSM 3645 TaxID=314230 RepID=A3ZX17_9BACT|nr:hypothetical protein DSM3645_27478 [Blastopirellula marina DSM 3645]
MVKSLLIRGTFALFSQSLFFLFSIANAVAISL